MRNLFLATISYLARKVIAATSIFYCIVGLVSISQAAEISLPVTGGRNLPLNGSILIEGPIVKGDFKRFQYLAFTFSADTVWLASPGGDLAEAIKIGQLVRRLKMDVWAPDSNKTAWYIMIRVSNPRNNLCASACFFIYAAGTQRFGDILGVHRPRITEEDLKVMTMDQAAFGQVSTSEIASDYLRKMGIPDSIIEKANTTKPNDIQWLTEAEVRSVSGYIPEYEDWFEAKCSETWRNVPEDPNPCKNCSTDELLARWSARAAEQKSRCKLDLAATAHTKARQEVLDEYVKNGRIQELIAEQQQVCATIKSKNQRECPESMRK